MRRPCWLSCRAIRVVLYSLRHNFVIMYKSKAKEKIKYIEKLDAEPRSRYLTKLNLLNGFDPYDCMEKVWTVDVNTLPPLAFGDMLTYLVYGVSAYTLDQFKSFKSLEAHNQFTNGWVHELKIFRPELSDNTVVKAKVLHSMRLSEKPLLPWVVLDSSGTVITAHCDCMAGLGETCTHVGALLFKIEAVVRIREKPTVTGQPAYWMIPSAVTKVQPEVGYRIDFTSAAAKKKQLDQSINSGQATPRSVRTGVTRTTQTPRLTPEELETFLSDMHSTGTKPAILSVMPKYCEQYKDPVAPVVLPKSLRSLRNPQHDDMPEVDLLSHCEKLFQIDPRIQIKKEETMKIETETKLQHNTPAWFAARAGRITASVLHDVCNFKFEKPASSTVNRVCYPGKQKVNTPAVKWGLQHEQDAVDQYASNQKREHFIFTFEKSGLIINCDFPYMGALPDGIVYCECCGKGCVEVKCPYKHRNSTISDACKDKDFCLFQSNGQFSLKTDHKYHYQIQCQLMASEADYCDLVVWTTVDCVTVRVVPDLGLFKYCQEKAKAFFVRVVLPELVAKYHSKKCSAPSSSGPSSEQAAVSQKRKPLCVSPEKNKPKSNSTSKMMKTSCKRKAILWCHCRRSESADDMVACDNQNCKIQWFHVGCVGLDELPSSDDTWFCSACLS